jgi:hypothetical protein
MRVETDSGVFDADIMVIALGADLDPSATPGLVESGHEFYSIPGAFALREVLSDFAGGHVIVGMTSTPFKCPPARRPAAGGRRSERQRDRALDARLLHATGHPRKLLHLVGDALGFSHPAIAGGLGSPTRRLRRP